MASSIGKKFGQMRQVSRGGGPGVLKYCRDGKSKDVEEGN